MKRLSGSDPSNVSMSRDLLRSCAMLGDLNLVLNDVVEARRFFAEYLSETRRRVDERPNDAGDRGRLIDALLRSADLNLRLLDLDHAERDLKAADAVVKAIAPADQDNTVKLAEAGIRSMSARIEMERRDPSKGAELRKRDRVHA